MARVAEGGRKRGSEWLAAGTDRQADGRETNGRPSKREAVEQFLRGANQ